MKKKEGGKVKSKEESNPLLHDTCCLPDEKLNNGFEEATKKKKKRKSKCPAESIELDQEVISKSDSKNQEGLIPDEEVVIKKKKKKKKEHSTNVNDATGEGSMKSVEEVVYKVKKRKRDAEILEFANVEITDLRNLEEKEEPNNNGLEEATKKKKKKKRKHSSSHICDQEQLTNIKELKSNVEFNDESAALKKKKVSWKEEISETKEPEVLEEDKKTTLEPTNNGFVSLLSKVDGIPDMEHRAKKRPQSLWQGKAVKKREKALHRSEKRSLRKQSRKEQKEREANKSKDLKCISDFNIKKRKLKEKTEELVGGSIETMDVKRPMLDGAIPAGPPRKRLKSITPEREVFPGHKWKDLTDVQKETFDRVREKRRLDKLSAPKIVLQNQANFSSLRLEDEERSPLTLSDIQHFLIYSLHGHHSTGSLPSWVSLKFASNISKIICVIVDGASLSDYTKHEDQLPALKSFNMQLDVITPYTYGGDFLREFWTVPLTRTQRARLIKTYGSLEKANLHGEAFESLRKMYPKGAFRAQKVHDDLKAPTNGTQAPTKVGFNGTPDQFPRTELLLRSWDLVRESVPVPFASGYLAKKYEGFVQTKDEYSEVTDESPIWAVDCEMCETCKGSELTRISIINEDFEVVYESLVKPYNPITNYLTQYSGITREDLQDVSTRLEDVQQDLRSLLPSDVILAGHSVGNDLLAMKMFHPYVIDTSVCFNLSGIRGRKTKLKTLMAELLYERIQEGGKKGHDSVEDAAACLKLIKAKLSRCIEWGDACLGGKRSELESVIAQQQLILRSKEEAVPTIYPVAAKSIIRSGPRAHQTVGKQPNLGKRPNLFLDKISAPLELKTPARDQAYDKTYSRSLINHLSGAVKKNVLVVGNANFLNISREQVDGKSQWFVQNSPKVRFSVQERDDVLTYGCENAPPNGISILRLPTSKLKEESPLKTVDAMIGQAVKNFSEIVLFTVLLTGKHPVDESSSLDHHGIFMMKIIKPAYVPLKFEDLHKNSS